MPYGNSANSAKTSLSRRLDGQKTIKKNLPKQIVDKKQLTVCEIHLMISAMNFDAPSLVTVTELRAHTLTGVVQREIEKMILSGQLAPGDRLNEKLLADKLLVSRGTVRETCRALA